jgi:primary-amine oxidase
MTFHPLDPLSPDEFRAASGILGREKGVAAGWRFASIEMVEPSKAHVAAFDATGSIPERLARAVVLNRAENATYIAVVSLTADALLNWEHVPDVQPNFTVDEWEEADAVLREHPDVIAALAKRGITDLSLVFMDTWT